MVLVVVEHDRGALAPATGEALTCGRQLAAQLDVPLEAITIGDDADDLVDELAAFGVTNVYQAHHDVLDDYGPETWGATIAAAVTELDPPVVLACGTDRGNEVLSQAAARLDAPMVANCVEFHPSDAGDAAEPWDVIRVRWGGSLLEKATIDADVKLLTVAHHSVVAEEADEATDPDTEDFDPELDDTLGRSRVVRRVERAAGVTLATAPVVIGGGRGVGSPEAFAPLEELAGSVGGVVGCSRAVTNNGWRPHTDQVGQTGTRIAPEIYFACGISGAIQHWVGAMAAKKILAINTDPEANMVTKSDYAILGDLHEVVPAITAEIERRRG